MVEVEELESIDMARGVDGELDAVESEGTR